MYHFLDESSIHWLTEALTDTVSATGGKVISILEGGYSLEETGHSATTKPSTRPKAKASVALPSVSLSASAQDESAAITSEVPVLPQRQGRGKNKKYEDDASAITTNASLVTEPPCATFSQLPGDGGLVKGFVNLCLCTELQWLFDLYLVCLCLVFSLTLPRWLE